MQRIKQASKLGDRLADPDVHDISFLVLFDGWPEDVERFHASVAANVAADWEIVVVDNPVDDEASQRLAALDRVEHVPLRDPVGYGAGRNIALRIATGRIVCVVDTSVELAGDASAALDACLSDASVGVAGRWGLRTSDGFAFEESDGPEVHAVEGYVMSMRRSDVARIGTFDPKFKYYRNADIDHSFRVRAAGFRAVVDPAMPVVRHEHRLWEATPPERRDAISHDNFHRFRRHWGDRPDLLEIARR